MQFGHPYSGRRDVQGLCLAEANAEAAASARLAGDEISLRVGFLRILGG